MRFNYLLTLLTLGGVAIAAPVANEASKSLSKNVHALDHRLMEMQALMPPKVVLASAPEEALVSPGTLVLAVISLEALAVVPALALEVLVEASAMVASVVVVSTAAVVVVVVAEEVVVVAAAVAAVMAMAMEVAMEVVTEAKAKAEVSVEVVALAEAVEEALALEEEEVEVAAAAVSRWSRCMVVPT